MKYVTIGVAIGVCLVATLTLSQDAGQDCSDVMCRMYCEYGYKKDNKGCDICECNVQTEIKEGQCPQIAADVVSTCVEACEHDGVCPNNQKCCYDGCGHACVDIVRDGFCPASESVSGTGDVGICAELCSADSECTDNNTLKCCLNACGGHTCVLPDTEKRGTCPIGKLAEGSLGLCADVCDRDADCPALQKCCSNGCGHVCITPIDLPEVHAGFCPEPPEGMDGVCADVCENDGVCSDSQKCCRNGCGAYSCTEAIDVPAKCDDVVCFRWCPYGLKKDDNGCVMCDCEEQKEIHAGECPVMKNDLATCTELCDHDGNCTENEKCCSNGCGHACVPSITPDPDECPINTFPERGEQQLGVCVEECTTTSDCDSGEVCCSNGCGHTCTKSATVHTGTCPTGNLELGWSGVCIEMCDNDGHCATNQKCCSNGCGHVCTTVEESPERCSDVLCQIFCEYGNKKDSNGCNICECQEPADAGVERPGECPIGLLPEGISGTCAEECTSDNDCVDKSQKCCSNGCGHVCTDALNVEPQCAPILCTRYCENGLQKDENGCDTCACNEDQECGTVLCQMYCPYGYKEDQYGCNICQCEETPAKCPQVMCQMFCPFGYQRDAEGCEVCTCTTSAAVTFVQEGTCPAVTGDENPGSCADLCDIDDECPAGEKCCYNGCGHVCVAPGAGGAATVLVSPIIILVLTSVALLVTSYL